MQFLYPFSAALAVTAASALPKSYPHLYQTDIRQLQRRQTQSRPQWPLKAHEMTEYPGWIWGFSVPVKIDTDAFGADKEEIFPLAIDTGSSKIWVESDLIPDEERGSGPFYEVPQAIQDRHDLYLESMGTCAAGVDSYKYASGVVGVQTLTTTIKIGDEDPIPDAPIGAAFGLGGKLASVPESVRDKGIIGLSPNAAIEWIDRLKLAPGTEILFDAHGKELSFEFLGDDGPGFEWIYGAVMDVADLWVIPADRLSEWKTNVLVDTGNSIIQLAEDLASDYYSQYPDDAYDLADDGTYYFDCALDTLYPLEIKIINQDKAMDFGLKASQVRGPYDSTDEATGKRWCVSYVGALKRVFANDQSLGAILGVSWLEHYQVAFDTYRKRIGIRAVQSS